MNIFIHDCETESALVRSLMCCLEGCERESFSDLKEQQNMQTKILLQQLLISERKAA